jgi:hypothetical protein
MKLSKYIFRSLLLFSFVFTTSIVGAQDEEEDDEIYSRIKPKHSMTIELGLPVPIRNKGFNGYLQGIVNFSPYYHYNFQNNLSLGIGGNYSYFWINRVLETSNKNLGGIHSTGLFLKLGHEKFYTDRLGTDIGVKFGGQQLTFDSEFNKTNHGGAISKTVYYIEPTIGIVLTASEFTSYRWIVGYTIQNYTFNPTQLGFASSSTFTGTDYSKPTQFLTVGFGFTYYFKQH